MELAYQPSMLDTVMPAVGPLTGGMVRHQLSRGAWVDHLPGWVLGSDTILSVLLEEVDWRAERRKMYDGVVDVPRLLRWYGERDELPHPLLTEARRDLTRHYVEELGEPFVTAGMCLYRDGRDSVAWHGDTIGRGARFDTMVAIVSFGSPRTLLLRPAAAATASASRSAMATSSSWAAPASAPGSTPSPRPPALWALASACSSAPPASPDRVRSLD
ncbi:hypothetical protein GCM10027610_004690 [Dactylosporangium cerinum]